MPAGKSEAGRQKERERSAIHRDLFRSGLFISVDVIYLSELTWLLGWVLWAVFSMLLLIPGRGYKVHMSP